MTKRSVLTVAGCGVAVVAAVSAFGMRPVEPDDTAKLRQEVAELKVALADQRLSTTKTAEDVSHLSRTSPPVGTVLSYAGTSAPEGWLLCDGQEYKLGEHPELTALSRMLGPRFYEREKNLVRLPDLRGRVVVGAGTGDGLTARTLGDKDGKEKHTLTVDEMPSHTHQSNFLLHTFGGEGDPVDQGTGNNIVKTGVNGEKVATNCIVGKTGGTRPHNIMQPFVVLTPIIKY